MRKLTAAAIIGALTFTISACSSDDDSSDAAATSTTTAEQTTTEEDPSASESDDSTSESPTSAADEDTAGSGELEQTPVSQTITDDVMGHTINVTNVVRGFPIPDENESLKETGEIVLVEVDITAGDTYSGGVQGGFRLKSSDGQTNARTTAFDDDVEAGGFTPFDGVSRGESGKAYVVFQVNEKSDGYSLLYKRSAAKVIGSDETIPEQEWEVPLV